MSVVYDEEQGAFHHEGQSWRPGQRIEDHHSRELHAIAYRGAAWACASTYPWKPQLWQSWMNRPEVAA